MLRPRTQRMKLHSKLDPTATPQLQYFQNTERNNLFNTMLLDTYVTRLLGTRQESWIRRNIYHFSAQILTDGNHHHPAVERLQIVIQRVYLGQV